jgi:hypothetical protein
MAKQIRNIKTGTKILTKDITGFQAVKAYFENNALTFYTFYLKLETPIKAIIHHLPYNTPAEDIADGLLGLGFDIVNAKQMSTSCRSPTGPWWRYSSPPPHGVFVCCLHNLAYITPRQTKKEEPLLYCYIPRRHLLSVCRHENVFAQQWLPLMVPLFWLSAVIAQYLFSSFAPITTIKGK